MHPLILSPGSRWSLPVVAMTLLLLAGCGSHGDAKVSPTKPPSTPSTQPLTTYHEGPPRPVAPARYVTGVGGFLPGLEVTIPAGWTTTEADAGEIGLHPTSNPDSGLFLWKDMRAVITHNRHFRAGRVDAHIGPTAQQLLDWLTHTPDFTVVSAPTPTTVGASVPGTQLTLVVSSTANFGWDDCPDNPRCAAILTDPKHWGGNFFAIGGDETARIFIATLHYPEGAHTLFITLDAPDQHQLATLAAAAQPIIDSLRLPEHFTDN